MVTRVLDEGTGAARQRRALARRGRMTDVVDMVVAETAAPGSVAGRVGAAHVVDPGDRIVAKLTSGMPAPPFTLADQDGNDVSLADFSGGQVVVYFYPADDTPGCTKEACQFNDNLSAFDRAGVPVLGVSPDDAASHVRFREKFGLGFPLLSDPDHEVMTAYGAWGEKSLYGKTVIGVIRSTFLVDAEGTIARAWYNVRSDGHAAKVLAETGR